MTLSGPEPDRRLGSAPPVLPDGVAKPLPSRPSLLIAVADRRIEHSAHGRGSRVRLPGHRQLLQIPGVALHRVQVARVGRRREQSHLVRSCPLTNGRRLVVACPVPDQIDPLVGGIFRPNVLQILQPVRRMLRPIEPTEQALVEHVQREEGVDRPEGCTRQGSARGAVEGTTSLRRAGSTGLGRSRPPRG